ncbi:(Fe-S)-binding protein [uncultured Mailhella sp.]|uniref:(Fe-S)-binding protein n=1 Tax=uncultured Mailhella sp. TaxID=1981031 RepID=UPI0025FD7B45|nr:(Fe-S)-binding protein [uncultured Mailhella sp.]
MSDISRLARTLMKLDDKLADCMRCGLCQAVCPVFGVTHKEADVSRGKLALLDNLAHKIIEDPDAVEEKLNRCLLCGSCQANCPSGVSILEIFMEARQALVDYRGLNPIKKLVFRELLTHPQLFSAMMRTAAPFQGLVMRQKGAKTYDMPLLSKLVGSRHIAKLPAKSLHAKYGSLHTEGQIGIKVLFFAGCMADKYYTQLGEACLKVLKHHGVGIVMPSDLTCCGIPALASGDRKGFVLETQKNLNVIGRELIGGGIDYVVTPCGSCTATLKEWWPYFIQDFSPEHQKTIKSVAERVMDINAFLVDVLHVDQMDPGERHPGKVTRVTFHDSCHLKKSVGVSEQPRKLIRMNPDYELVEMAEADRCCGCGGSFTLFHYDLSKEIGQRKRDNIVNTGATAVATGCPACMLQISDMLSQNKDEVVVKHPIEIYAETLPD